MSIIHPVNEQETIYHFIHLAKQMNIEIINFFTTYPDATIKIGDTEYLVEFEYKLLSFLQQGHDPRECNLVVCWTTDKFPKRIEFPLPVWELSTNTYQDIFVPNQECINRYVKYLADRSYSKEWSYKKRYAKKNPETSIGRFSEYTK